METNSRRSWFVEDWNAPPMAPNKKSKGLKRFLTRPYQRVKNWVQSLFNRKDDSEIEDSINISNVDSFLHQPSAHDTGVQEGTIPIVEPGEPAQSPHFAPSGSTLVQEGIESPFLTPPVGRVDNTANPFADPQ